jgi:hypothetical protein
MKAESKKFLKFREEYAKIMKLEGYRALYKGVQTSFYSCFFPCMIYFLSYEELLVVLDKQFGDHKHAKIGIPFMASAVAELLCLLLNVPLDIIRTRYQINTPEYQYKSVFHAIKETSQKEGFFRLF